MDRVIGIDFGTTKSIAAVIEDGKPIVIPCHEGYCLTPSVVAFSNNGERIIGQAALNQAIVNPQNTIFSIKRILGRKFSDPEVQKVLQRVSYKVTRAGDDEICIICADREYRPQEIAAMVLGKLKSDAETYLGETVAQAVIAVPAYSNDAQRKAIKDAGNLAGLEVLQLVNEPSAAALAHSFGKIKNGWKAVFDLGGGNFNFSIIRSGEGVFDVKSTNGNTLLGGDDFDGRVIDYIADEFQKEHAIDLCQDCQALLRLKTAAQKAKIELSSTLQTEIDLPYITADENGPKHLVRRLARLKLEELTADLIDRTIWPARQTLKDAGIQAEQIDDLVLVGGMARMPAVQETLSKLFSKEARVNVKPDEIIANGAAILAGMLDGEVKDLLLLDVAPLTLSLETTGGAATPIIGRNTTIPASRSFIFSTAADNQKKIELHLLQGERVRAENNLSLGKFSVDKIPRAHKGVPRVEIGFEIDASGILKVTARDLAAKRPLSVTTRTAAE
jgi:molecular chaperone DnaK